jgi:hypothetical protein
MEHSSAPEPSVASRVVTWVTCSLALAFWIVGFGVGSGYYVWFATFYAYLGLLVLPSAILLCRNIWQDEIASHPLVTVAFYVCGCKLQLRLVKSRVPHVCSIGLQLPVVVCLIGLGSGKSHNGQLAHALNQSFPPVYVVYFETPLHFIASSLFALSGALTIFHFVW